MERQIKRDYFRKAKQLGYLDVMPDIKKRIYASERETNILRIMTTARHLMTQKGR